MIDSFYYYLSDQSYVNRCLMKPWIHSDVYSLGHESIGYFAPVFSYSLVVFKQVSDQFFQIILKTQVRQFDNFRKIRNYKRIIFWLFIFLWGYVEIIPAWVHKPQCGQTLGWRSPGCSGLTAREYTLSRCSSTLWCWGPALLRWFVLFGVPR